MASYSSDRQVNLHSVEVLTFPQNVSNFLKGRTFRTIHTLGRRSVFTTSIREHITQWSMHAQAHMYHSIQVVQTPETSQSQKSRCLPSCFFLPQKFLVSRHSPLLNKFKYSISLVILAAHNLVNWKLIYYLKNTFIHQMICWNIAVL